MTLKQFFAKARRGKKWRVIGINADVRCARGFCPLGAVARIRERDFWDEKWLRSLERMPDPEKAAASLGLRRSLADRIALAADDADDKYRPWLLKNLGVSVPHTGAPTNE